MRSALLAFLILAEPVAHSGWANLPPLPSAVSNNAVASYVRKDRTLIYSFMGMGHAKDYSSITTTAMVYETRHEQWLLLPSVPGKMGRLAASAVVVDGQIYVLGGYTVDAKGKKTTVADVDIYTPNADEPTSGYWAKGVPMPIVVSDSVVGVVDDRFILMVSGWSKEDAVTNVQLYDTWHDHWRPGTMIAGPAVFGHAGAVVNKNIIYCGGAYKNPDAANEVAQRFVASDACWQGRITSTDPFKIEWQQLPPHPGDARYRMAAGVWEKKVVFTGGTSEPYDYAGFVDNAKRADPSPTTFDWNTDSHAWEVLPDDPEPTMDTHQLATDKTGLVMVGGMQPGQKVSKRVARLTLQK